MKMKVSEILLENLYPPNLIKKYWDISVKVINYNKIEKSIIEYSNVNDVNITRCSENNTAKGNKQVTVGCYRDSKKNGEKKINRYGILV